MMSETSKISEYLSTRLHSTKKLNNPQTTNRLTPEQKREQLEQLEAFAELSADDMDDCLVDCYTGKTHKISELDQIKRLNSTRSKSDLFWYEIVGLKYYRLKLRSVVCRTRSFLKSIGKLMKTYLVEGLRARLRREG